MAIYTVTNLNYTGVGSLRRAITDANRNPGLDTIVFQTGLAGTITLTGQLPDITDSLIITGPGAENLTIDADNLVRIFRVVNTASVINVTISGMTLTNGLADRGGAIISEGESLTLQDVAILNNTATSDGGGIWFHGNENTALVIQNSTISGNSAPNAANGGGDGAGIYIFDSGSNGVTIQNSTVSGNRAAGDGGAIYIRELGGDFVIDNSQIIDNHAQDDGGGINVDFSLHCGLIIRNNTSIADNTAGDNGGGIYIEDTAEIVTIEDSIITGNTSGDNGGGVYIRNTGTVVIERTWLYDNIGNGTAQDLSRLGGLFSIRNSLIEAPNNAINGANDHNFLGQEPNLTTVEATSNYATEEDGVLLYTFTRTGSTTNALTVNFTVDGTALFGADGDYTQLGATSFDGQTGTLTLSSLNVNSIARFEPRDVRLKSHKTRLFTRGKPGFAPVSNSCSQDELEFGLISVVAKRNALCKSISWC